MVTDLLPGAAGAQRALERGQRRRAAGGGIGQDGRQNVSLPVGVQAGKGSLVTSELLRCMGGSSMDERGSRRFSVSECQSCDRTRSVSSGAGRGGSQGRGRAHSFRLPVRVQGCGCGAGRGRRRHWRPGAFRRRRRRRRSRRHGAGCRGRSSVAVGRRHRVGEALFWWGLGPDWWVGVVLVVVLLVRVMLVRLGRALAGRVLIMSRNSPRWRAAWRCSARVGAADVLLHGAVALLLDGRGGRSARGPGQRAGRKRERERERERAKERGVARARRAATYADAALAAAGAVGVAQRADDLIVGVGDGEGRGEGGPGRHLDGGDPTMRCRGARAGRAIAVDKDSMSKLADGKELKLWHLTRRAARAGEGAARRGGPGATGKLQAPDRGRVTRDVSKKCGRRSGGQRSREKAER